MTAILECVHSSLTYQCSFDPCAGCGEVRPTCMRSERNQWCTTCRVEEEPCSICGVLTVWRTIVNANPVCDVCAIRDDYAVKVPRTNRMINND